MKRILFVDDEPQLLAALGNNLRKLRTEWELVFALGGEAALEELKQGSFDVIVSDMRMPGMDGATLFRKVREKYPGVARIILSGQSDRDAVVRALPVTQQFLTKPCEPGELRTAITRVCALQSLLADRSVRGAIGRLDKLPSFPEIYWELTRAIEGADASVADVAKIVEKDPTLAAKVLQLVNSAYFGLARPTTSIQGAVAYLGLELLKALALSAHVFVAMDRSARSSELLGDLQMHSFATAQLAKKLVNEKKRTEEAFTSALLHDVGRIILALNFPDRFTDVLRIAASTGRPMHALEKELCGATHAELGAYLLGLWGVPFTIVEAVAYHHTPSLVPEGPVDVLAAVHVTDALTEESGELDEAFAERAGLASRIPEFKALAGKG